MQMCVKRKLRRQFGTSRALFQTYLSEFRWRNFHRNDDKFNALMCCIAELYVVYIDIIFCPTDCVTILFHVFCQYTSFKIALIIYATILQQVVQGSGVAEAIQCARHKHWEGVSYNIESSTIYTTLIDKNFLKLFTPLLSRSPLYNLGEYASMQGEIACHSSQST